MSRIQNKNLTIYHENDNLSNTLSVFKGFKTLSLDAATYLYIGYQKQVHSLYIDLQKPNTDSSILVIEKWDGSEWVIVDRQDETFDLNKSGHIFTNDFEEAKTTYKGIEQYWTRISTVEETDDMEIRYINLIFSNFEDLLAEDPNVELLYPLDSATNTEIKTFLNAQIAARESLLQWLNQAGKYKYKPTGMEVALLTQWDVFNVNELRSTHKYLTLHNIHLSMIDNKDDNEKWKADYYWKRAKDAFAEAHSSILTLDTNDSGKIDNEEVAESTTNCYRLKL